MALYLEVYLRNKPDFSGFLAEDLKVMPIEPTKEHKYYRWYPVDNCGDEVMMIMTGPCPPSITLRSKKRVYADKENYEKFQRDPNSMRHEPVWQILEFSHGEDLYEVDLTACLSVNYNSFMGMCRFANYLAETCDGVIWDGRRMGRPDEEKMYLEGKVLLSKMKPMLLQMPNVFFPPEFFKSFRKD